MESTVILSSSSSQFSLTKPTSQFSTTLLLTRPSFTAFPPLLFTSSSSLRSSPLTITAALPIDSGAGDESDNGDVITLRVTGMMCGGCAASVKRILENQPQVSSATVDLTSETAVVLPVTEAKSSPDWSVQLGESLAKHLSSCGFPSNPGESEGNMDDYGGDSHTAQETDNSQHIGDSGENQQDDNSANMHTEGGETEHPTHHQPNSRLSNKERLEILNHLLIKCVAGKLPRGTINATAQQFGTSNRIVGRIWAIAKGQHLGANGYNVNTKFSNCGRKRVQVSQEHIKSIKMGDKSCIRDLASKLSIGKSTCHRLLKFGEIKPHTNSLHPGLTNEHKQTRLRWILSLLQGTTLAEKNKYFPMYDFVHTDEKWFFLTKKTNRCYLAKNEQGVYRAASSSKYIPKVMFSACVARLRYNSDGVCVFDGKIGIFPFTYKEAARNNSKNRRKGTMVTKLIDPINQNVTRAMLIDHILPAIKSKWPNDGQHRTIFIQQDNARAHITQEDNQWQGIYQQEGFTFILIQQPANSPDLNILDLGFFRSIQSLMHKKMPKDIDQMVQCVEEAFYELDPITLGNVWMSLQFVMNEILKCNGGNNYDMPHVSKKKLGLEGNKPTEVNAPSWAITNAWNAVFGSTSAAGTSNEGGGDDVEEM